jgi:hypothetical protein
MPYVSPSVVLATLLASAPVWAQSTQLADREITPGAFLGVDLHGNFMTEVPECASQDDRPSKPCRIATKKDGRFEVRGLPYLPITPGYKLFATMTDGSVSQLVLTGNSSSLNLVKEMLTDELGKPAASSTHWVKLKSGASFEAETYKWDVQGIAVDFGRDLSDLGRYSVTFSTSVVSSGIRNNEATPVIEGASL